MLNDEEATRAIRELNGAVLNGNRLNVEVCICYYEGKLPLSLWIICTV